MSEQISAGKRVSELANNSREKSELVTKYQPGKE